MDKKRYRGYSDEEEDKENRMEKRLRRLEDAILEIRDNKRHKKRRRRHRSSMSPSSEANRRRRSRGKSRGRSQFRRSSSKGSSVYDESIQRELSYSPSEQFVDQTAAQVGSLSSSSAEGQVVHHTATQAVLGQDPPAINKITQQTVTVTQSGAPQGSSAADLLVQQTAQSSVVTEPVIQASALHLNPSQSHSVAGEETQSTQAAICEGSLDPAILEILGRRFLEDRVLAEAIPKDLVVRLEEILKTGLPTEDRVSLIKKHPPPSNCVIIDPPRVNPEVQASLHGSVVKRDERIHAKQSKITACLAAIVKVFSRVLEGGAEKLLILELLGDASRLLADLLHDESIIRKSLILANLNVSCKETLNATVPDEWLFGQQLEEKLKAEKALESSRKELKAPQKPQGQKNSKNSTAPPRRPQNNQRFATTSGGRKEPRNQGYSSFRRDNHKNGTNWKNNQKSERSNNRKRY
ncbi:uncharacterized protein LOC124297113 [Neodiprion virginianus]|uniref:uncharacterized protein LOC124297113 n=1 Tax=Neodiprion virginianus TaxID=2961670 RepID=UPI001EE772DA|nr:uncharacterized protein LOC124297113 [Neodiprion virginianus]